MSHGKMLPVMPIYRLLCAIMEPVFLTTDAFSVHVFLGVHTFCFGPETPPTITAWQLRLNDMGLNHGPCQFNNYTSFSVSKPAQKSRGVLTVFKARTLSEVMSEPCWHLLAKDIIKVILMIRNVKTVEGEGNQSSVLGYQEAIDSWSREATS